MASDQLKQIAGEMVVFQKPGNDPNRYFSNDPRWNDSRIRKAWLDNYSDEALKSAEEEEVQDLDDPQYEAWKNADLRMELAERGLSVDGTKAEMVARLRESDDQDDQDEPQDEQQES